MSYTWGGFRAHKLVSKYGFFHNRLAQNDQQITKAKLRQFNLKPVTSIKFEYDPFNAQSASIRQLCMVLHTPRWRATNLECPCQVSIRGDRCAPTVRMGFLDGQSLVIKTANFSLADLVELIQRQTLLHTPAETPEASA